ncbi:SLC13 family permease [Salipaludibacillus sp. LMS25]|uniref:SLC13 family permease n=1 Tax=Salipaludibacillus sp. LMS25 TaxID=2924031 RepID=UPI0020D1C3DC|nr:SLC13 family permease [Salipaludibacillus sp. LMS25]UTR14971.1 SLC13 family permease [Salipaludibacillus sp. LMS25]
MRIINGVLSKAWESHDRIIDMIRFMGGRSDGEIPTDYKGRMEKVSGKMTGTYRQPSPDKRDFSKKQLIGLIVGPLLFLLVFLFFQPEGLSFEARGVLGGTVWIATWWITEAIPIPVTSLLPIILFPLVTTLQVGDVTPHYGNDIVFLFLGGFIIALALERWNLHKRIALTIIHLVGTSTKRLMLGFMIATAFLSMWISNTATAMMMVPIGTAIIYQVTHLIDDRFVDNPKKEANQFAKGLMIAIAFSASIGGLGTIIGTPPNTILAGQLREIFDVDLSFGYWMLFGVPLATFLLILAWFYLITFAFPMKMKNIPNGREIVENERKALGDMSSDEKVVMSIFSLTAIAWMTRSFLLQEYVHPNINDTLIAITGASLLFLIPSFKYEGVKLMNWHTAKNVPWGILILFGGGLAIAGAFGETGLDLWIGEQLSVLIGVKFIFIILAVTFFVMFLTEITSNTASATMLMPIMASLAYAIDVHPLAMMVPAALAASCAFMLPVATPPNAVVFGSGYLKMADMVKAGFWMNVLAIIGVVTFVILLLPLVFGIDLTSFPN